VAYAQTRYEEHLNVLTHGIMAAAVMIMLPWAVWNAGRVSFRNGAGVAVFCGCLILMFGVSAVYHGLPAGGAAKKVLNRLDHMAIFFAIAGSYTPIAIAVIGGRTGQSILIMEWILVLVGILFKILAFKKNRLTWILSTVLYLLMGWAVVICLPVFIRQANPVFAWLILAGGVFYTGGILFFAQSRRYAHVIWHFFVDAGAACHFLAIAVFL